MPQSTFLRRWPSPLLLLALLAMALAGYHYATGEVTTLPLQLVPHLQPLPLTLEQVPVGAATLPVQANGYITTLTHDLAGPFTRPDAAALWVALLGLVLAGWLAVVSTLPRPAFVGGMALAFFFLMSLNVDLLGVFNEAKQYFLLLALGLLGGVGFGLHAFGERIGLGRRGLIFGVLVAGLGGLLFSRSQFSTAETVLHLAAYATLGGAALLALLVLWLGFENVHGLLWLNTQAAQRSGRFGVLPLLAASLLYLAPLGLYYWNNGELLLLAGLRFDPLALLVPAALVGVLGLRRRAATVAGWLPPGLPGAPGLHQLLPLVLTGAAGALGYALATANSPLLQAAREFTNLAFLALGTAFLLYLLLNFAPLLQQRLPVYRVVFEPRRFPFYAMYMLGLLTVVLVLVRSQFAVLNQVRAGFYNELGDLTRQQSEADPDNLSRALLAERYYAESDALDRNNPRAALGRAALYRFRGQPRNELLALSRALRRAPSEKISLHLAALYNAPQDFFDAQQVLRQGLRDNPGSAALANDLAQLYTRSALTDSVAFYLDLAARRAPGAYPSRTNQLGFLLSQNLLVEAEKRTQPSVSAPEMPAFAANQMLLKLLQGKPEALSAAASARAAVPGPPLDDARFALLYHAALARQSATDTTLLPMLRQAAARPENAAYTDQLEFAQALLLHGAGQEQRARQQLSSLTAGTSPTAAYYQQVLGLWQLRQGQYGTAAAQLTQASANGAATAYVARAHALLLAGQPDSARAEVNRLVSSADTARQRLGRELQAQLAVASRPGDQSVPAQLPTTIAQTGSVTALQQLAAAARTRLAPVGSETLRQARLTELKNQPVEARKSYARLLREAPFSEPAVLAAARFFTNQRDYAAAHEALRRGLEENPEAPALLAAYVLAAAQAGLPDYAADALTRVRPQLSPAAYATLQQRLAAVRAAQKAATASFNATP